MHELLEERERGTRENWNWICVACQQNLLTPRSQPHLHARRQTPDAPGPCLSPQLSPCLFALSFPFLPPIFLQHFSVGKILVLCETAIRGLVTTAPSTPKIASPGSVPSAFSRLQSAADTKSPSLRGIAFLTHPHPSSRLAQHRCSL